MRAAGFALLCSLDYEICPEYLVLEASDLHHPKLQAGIHKSPLSLSLSWTWILKTLKAYQRKDRKLGVSASNLKVSDSHKGSRCLNLSTKGEKTTPKSEKL
jgi:hypothetical protein